jgi:hypothetical protein
VAGNVATFAINDCSSSILLLLILKLLAMLTSGFKCKKKSKLLPFKYDQSLDNYFFIMSFGSTYSLIQFVFFPPSSSGVLSSKFASLYNIKNNSVKYFSNTDYDVHYHPAIFFKKKIPPCKESNLNSTCV